MTRTIQSCSLVSLREAKGELDKNESETEDNMDLLLQVFDSFNNLSEKLNRLNYLLQKNNIEQILYPKEEGEKK